MNEIASRLAELMHTKGMTVISLAKDSGVPEETIKNLYYGKVTNPRLNTISALARSLDVSINYLLGNTEENSDVYNLIQKFYDCGRHGKQLILMIAEIESNLAKKERNECDKWRIPCAIPVGDVIDGILYNSCDVEYIYTDNPDATLAIEITSDYFMPAYFCGDKILIDRRSPRRGERGIFMFDGKAYFREFEKDKDGNYVLKCLNGNGKDMVMKRLNGCIIIGTCIGVIRSE